VSLSPDGAAAGSFLTSQALVQMPVQVGPRSAEETQGQCQESRDG